MELCHDRAAGHTLTKAPSSPDGGATADCTRPLRTGGVSHGVRMACEPCASSGAVAAPGSPLGAGEEDPKGLALAAGRGGVCTPGGTGDGAGGGGRGGASPRPATVLSGPGWPPTRLPGNRELLTCLTGRGAYGLLDSPHFHCFFWSLPLSLSPPLPLSLPRPCALPLSLPHPFQGSCSALQAPGLCPLPGPHPFPKLCGTPESVKMFVT